MAIIHAFKRVPAPLFAALTVGLVIVGLFAFFLGIFSLFTSSAQATYRTPVYHPKALLLENEEAPKQNIQLFASLQPEKMPATAPNRSSMIAIVIDDMGLSQAYFDQIMQMGSPLTLSFLPYGKYVQEQAAEASKAGHELFLHLPMEPFDTRKDPGPNALMAAFDNREIAKALHENLTQFDGYVGVNNHMGSKFTARSAGMKVVIRELKRRGLIFLDSKTSSSSVGEGLAYQYGLPYAGRDIFIDHFHDNDFIEHQFERLLKTARIKGYAIAIAHPKAKTLQKLSEWLPRFEAKGVRIVPVSEIIKHQSSKPIQS